VPGLGSRPSGAWHEGKVSGAKALERHLMTEENMKKACLPLVALCPLALQPVTPGWSGGTAAAGDKEQSQAKTDPLPLPPLPYFDAVRWLKSEDVLKSLKIDELLLQKPKFGQFVVKPVSPDQDKFAYRPD
jgi:hypothetical protein